MRILKIIHGYPPTHNAGSEVYSQNISEWLAERHEVLVFTREENPFATDHSLRYEKRGKVDLAIINKARDKDGYRHEATDFAIKSVIQRFKPDVAHIGHLNHLSIGIPETLKQCDVPSVFTLHDFWLMCPRGQFLQVNFGEETFHRLCDGQEDRKCARRCYNRFFSGYPEHQTNDENFWENWIGCRMNAARSATGTVDRFIAPSRHLMKRFINEFGIDSSKIEYLDYGFPLVRLAPCLTLSPNEPFTFGYIGTHIPAKGVDLLIRAFSQLKVPAKLKIWGRHLGAATAALEALAISLGLRVSFMGEYHNREIAEKVFSQVHCIVVPSIWEENSPLVIHEAQACKVPVITADVGGMAEYVKDGVNGLLFRHRDEADLAGKMTLAATNPAAMQRLGKRGYLHHPQGQVPGLDEHCEALLDIYRKVIFEKQKSITHEKA